MAGRPPPRRNNDRQDLVGKAPARSQPPSTYSPTADPDQTQAQLHQERMEALQQEQRRYLTEAVRSSHATVNTGHATTQELAKQGETIERVDKGVENIEYELKVSDKLVKNMSGLTGMVASWFMKDPKPKKKSDAACCKADDSAVRKDTKSKSYSVPDRSTTTTTTSTSDNANPHDIETDKLLGELANNLSVMRDQAHTQQGILRDQHKQLDELTKKVDKTNQHMKKTDANIKKIT
eukprot:GDKK01050071.1.p1 GENE.GDKK01050071.1~~GDKK01050071.1.p1  ORF type:complete len:236 (-),score=26.91 GDKK01050071.1:62-769(-)